MSSRQRLLTSPHQNVVLLLAIKFDYGHRCTGSIFLPVPVLEQFSGGSGSGSKTDFNPLMFLSSVLELTSIFWRFQVRFENWIQFSGCSGSGSLRFFSLIQLSVLMLVPIPDGICKARVIKPTKQNYQPSTKKKK